MHVISPIKLQESYESPEKEDLRIVLERWYDIGQQAGWHNPSEIKEDSSATEYVRNQNYIFNINGNNYRLVVVVKFTIGRILLRFTGTHSEYDKIDCSTI